MKKLTIMLLLCISTTTAYAEESICSSVYELAKNIMTARQKEAPMPAIMKVADSIEDEMTKKLTKDLIKVVYETPAYSSETMQQKEISSFANTIYLGCINILKE